MNEYNSLKSVIVGREAEFNDNAFDVTFRAFYKENLKDLDISELYKNEYTNEIFKKRNEGLDNLAKTLQKLNINVYRPKKTRLENISLPKFKSIIRNSSNVRDTAIIINKTIIETSPVLRGRIFENSNLYTIFQDFFLNKNYNWIKAPQDIHNEKVDYENMKDYKEFFKKNLDLYKNYNLFFDAANMIKCDDFILFNATNYNDYQGYQWIKKNVNVPVFHVMLTDSHIDGIIVPIDKDTYLVNDARLNEPIEKFLPDFMVKKSKFVKLPKNCKNEFDNINDFPYLASKEGMSINVLSIGNRTIIVNKNEEIVCDLLEKNNFKVIEVDLPYCRAFGGGIHCSTLDIERE